MLRLEGSSFVIGVRDRLPLGSSQKVRLSNSYYVAVMRAMLDRGEESRFRYRAALNECRAVLVQGKHEHPVPHPRTKRLETRQLQIDTQAFGNKMTRSWAALRRRGFRSDDKPTARGYFGSMSIVAPRHLAGAPFEPRLGVGGLRLAIDEELSQLDSPSQTEDRV